MNKQNFLLKLYTLANTVNIYSISKAFNEINKLKEELKQVKKILSEHGWLNEEK